MQRRLLTDARQAAAVPRAPRLTGLACVLVVLGDLVSVLPARVAGRTPVAAILRSE